jgi:GNAT superfamily N-acetyltransferase
MAEIELAKAEDAEELAALYAKAFRETGFADIASEEKREELVVWLRDHCAAGRIWFNRDEAGPLTLAHYDSDKDEVTAIATRDGMERKGAGAQLFEALCAKFPTARVQPVTRGGKALAKKFGFALSEADKSVWSRKTSGPTDE